ncbi:phosphopyruvate hydratase [Mesomycoplasma flocculare]|uniref:Enolase n=1 Tax=Mesomycoplasma flocculare ATCC 27399 TaxID=743971 RepID=A0A0A8E7B5_MESFC|nr:phosphopyruvate hydratase [Mesomycoplasma flocculare]AJC49879.1 enolase [Mesomycoplasma flocculare ATCC 27399]ENX51215.1 enolase [Mesomycoplasma flocculare ATCC 27716]
MSKITKIFAREILDSRGNPTIQVEVYTLAGGFGTAIVPSGASTGSKEALELRDGNTKYADNWYGQKGVMTAVDNVNNIIAPKIIGFCVKNQRLIDQKMIELDGTPNKEKLGANAILGVSLAVAKAAANELRLPLFRYLGGPNPTLMPVPMLNIINGGEHASNTLDFQEFMIMPLGFSTFRKALQAANKIFHNLAKLLKKAGYGTQVGDEGGFAPNLNSHEQALDFLVKAIKESGLNPAIEGENAIAIAIDAAASEFYNGEKYVFKKLKTALSNKSDTEKNQKFEFSSTELLDYYERLFTKYPIISVEDGFAESDWQGFVAFTERFGKTHQIVGDDLTVTNVKILKEAIKSKAINSILIKLNQIGTLSETLDAIQLAQKSGMTAVISHRSGESEDTTIADLAVAISAGQIKTGSLSRTDRIAKYNRLLIIEEYLNSFSKSEYIGKGVFYNLKNN